MSIETFTKPKKKKAEKVQPYIGLPLGRTVNGGMELFASLEDVGVIFAGPRTGKSTAYAVPFILAAQGPALVTSNKNDLHHHTRGVREVMGRVFAFDPEGIATHGEQGWWLNPLRGATSPNKAKALADMIEAAEGGGAADAAASKGVDFFPARGKVLLRAMFLAASVSEGWTAETDAYKGPAYFLRDVQEWLSEPESKDPVPLQILDQTSYREVVNELAGIFGAAPEERSGVFSSAQLLVSFLADPQISDWVNPRPGEEEGRRGRETFDPERFMTGTNTLYSLSSDGYGSAKALVTALTQSVLDAATEKAKTEPAGRLSMPMACILDEAANVCPWPDLPKLYSHFGSRGILVWTILQSYDQGVGVWGRHGMEALMTAANHRLYGGGNLPGHLLDLISNAVGDYHYTTPGSPASKGSPAGPRQEHKDRIFDVSELQALPRGRAILLSSGNRAALVRTVPWQAGPFNEAVRASVAKYDPEAEKTLREEMSEYESSLSDPDLTVGSGA